MNNGKGIDEAYLNDLGIYVRNSRFYTSSEYNNSARGTSLRSVCEPTGDNTTTPDTKDEQNTKITQNNGQTRNSTTMSEQVNWRTPIFHPLPQAIAAPAMPRLHPIIRTVQRPVPINIEPSKQNPTQAAATFICNETATSKYVPPILRQALIEGAGAYTQLNFNRIVQFPQTSNAEDAGICNDQPAADRNAAAQQWENVASGSRALQNNKGLVPYVRAGFAEPRAVFREPERAPLPLLPLYARMPPAVQYLRIRFNRILHSLLHAKRPLTTPQREVMPKVRNLILKLKNPAAEKIVHVQGCLMVDPSRRYGLCLFCLDSAPQNWVPVKIHCVAHVSVVAHICCEGCKRGIVKFENIDSCIDCTYTYHQEQSEIHRGSIFQSL